jgi:hypothetical protein
MLNYVKLKSDKLNALNKADIQHLSESIFFFNQVCLPQIYENILNVYNTLNI